MADMVAQYTAIGDLLAADKTDGVAGHAEAMLKIMDEHEAMMKEGGHMKGEMGGMMHSKEEMQAMHKAMRASLTALSAKDLTLESARDAYKDLSEQFVPMAKMGYEKRDLDPSWVVMHCPMAKAEWIQKDGKVMNPYLGSKMLHCGTKVWDLSNPHDEGHDQSKSSGHHMGGMH